MNIWRESLGGTRFHCEAPARDKQLIHALLCTVTTQAVMLSQSHCQKGRQRNNNNQSPPKIHWAWNLSNKNRSENYQSNMNGSLQFAEFINWKRQFLEDDAIMTTKLSCVYDFQRDVFIWIWIVIEDCHQSSLAYYWRNIAHSRGWSNMASSNACTWTTYQSLVPHWICLISNEKNVEGRLNQSSHSLQFVFGKTVVISVRLESSDSSRCLRDVLHRKTLKVNEAFPEMSIEINFTLANGSASPTVVSISNLYWKSLKSSLQIMNIHSLLENEKIYWKFPSADSLSRPKATVNGNNQRRNDITFDNEMLSRPPQDVNFIPIRISVAIETCTTSPEYQI